MSHKININIITMFPQMFEYFKYGLLSKSIGSICNLNIIDLKIFGKHNRVDDTTYGGHGMIIKPDVIQKCLEHYNIVNNIYITSPRGRIWDQDYVHNIKKDIILGEQNKPYIMSIICGRYEGIDQRVIDYYNMIEISIGDVILTGGELPSMLIIDSLLRTIPGTLGNNNSLDDSFSKCNLEHDNYTKPYIWNSISVPNVLLSGNHKLIYKWKLDNNKKKTIKNRPDLLYKLINMIGKII